MVFDRSGETVHRVSSEAMPLLILLQDGVDPADIPADLIDEVDSLIEAGLVADSSMISRRKVLATGGAAWTAATVATFALADPAAAATACPGGVVPTSPTVQKYTTRGNYTYTTGFGVTSLIVRAWGAGGGGGGGGVSTGGGGGGGGAYAYSPSVTVTPCTPYTVIVGAGGAGGARGGAATAGKNGGNGSSSSFFQGSVLSAAGGSRGVGGAFFNPGDGGGGGSTAGSVGTTKHAGGSGEDGATAAGGGAGGGSAGNTGNGGNGSGGASILNQTATGGSAGTGTPSGSETTAMLCAAVRSPSGWDGRAESSRLSNLPVAGSSERTRTDRLATCTARLKLHV